MNVSAFSKSLERARKRAEERHLEAAVNAYARLIRRVGNMASTQLRAQSVTAAASWQPPPDGLLFQVATVAPVAARALSSIHERIVAAVSGPPLERIGIAWDVSHPLTADLLAKAAQRTGEQLGEAVQPVLREAVAQAYAEGLSVRDAASLIREKIDEAAPWQAEMLARTDLNGLSNGGSVIAAKLAGVATKTWLTASDGQVRPAHAAASGQSVPIDQPFLVGGESLAYPGDPAGSDGNVANCRCSVLFDEVAAEAKTTASTADQWAAENIDSLSLGEAGNRETASVIRGARDVLEPYDLGLDSIRTGKTPGETGMAGAIWRNGGRPGKPGEIVIREDLLDHEAALSRAADLLRIWRKGASERLLERADRYAVWQDADDPIRTVIAHEAGHELYFQKVTGRAWSAALRAEKVTLEDRLRISEYAASDPQELFCEAIAMQATGRTIPSPIARALTRVLETIDEPALVGGARAMSEVLTAAVAAPVRWQAVLAVEGEPTEDGRMLAPGSITWRDTPLPLMGLTQTGPGGHEGAEVAGRIDEIWRDGSKIMGAGCFDSGEIGAEVSRLVREQTLRGVSVDLAIREFEVQLLDEEGAPSGEAADTDALLDALAEGVDVLHVVTDGVIGMATVCPFQAIGNASIAITASADETEWTLAREDGAFTFPGPTIDDQIAARLGALAHVTEMRAKKEQAEHRVAEMETLVQTVRDEARQETVEQKQSMLALIDSLTGRIASGEQITEAMLATLSKLAEPKPPRAVRVIRDDNGRATGYEETPA